MKITVEMLASLGACATQLRLFGQEWPDGCEINAENLAKTRLTRLDVEWFLSTVLTKEEYDLYISTKSKCFAKFDEKVKTALSVFNDAQTAAYAHFQFMLSIISEEHAAVVYKHIRDHNLAAFRQAQDAAYAVYYATIDDVAVIILENNVLLRNMQE